jgi:trk system potassium uptake protein TrkH
MIRLFSLARLFGLMLMVFSAAYALPLLAAWIYHDGTAGLFAKDWLITFALGGILWLASKDHRRELKAKDGFLLVLLAWSGMAAVSALPLMGYQENLSFTDAYFESMSGLSTTGATVMAGLDRLPPAVNLWRHELHWLGGMSIIVLAVAVLPILGVGGRQVFMSETPGPMKDSKLTPRIAETAKNLWSIYAGLTLACILALKLAGMDWFDALCHAFSTLGLGGFSTHDDNVRFFNSPAVEGVLMVFMLLSGMNFATHFLAVRNRSLNPYRYDVEAKPYLALILGSCLGIAIFLNVQETYPDFWDALRYAAFNVISIATDCGFSNADYSRWPIFAPLWMLFLACVTVCTGSTGGGIKMMRTLLLEKQSEAQLFLLTHPTAIHPLKLGKMIVQSNIQLSVLGFIFVYFMSIVLLSLVLIASGLDFVSAFSAIVACLNNAGPGLEQVGPVTTYAVLTDFQTWICTLAMFLGRVEILTAFVVFTPAFWRK